MTTAADIPRLYSASQAYALDQAAVTAGGFVDGELMSRAGAAAYRLLRLKWPRARRITIVCGPGNNGGDGYVLASQLLAEGLQATVVTLGSPDRQSGDALAVREAFQLAGGQLSTFSGDLPTADLVVDALLGIGSGRMLEGDYAGVVGAINNQPAPVLALDLPSGIHADTGAVLGVAVKASATLCFIGMKRGLVTGAATDHVGELYLDDLGVGADVRQRVECSSFLVEHRGCQAIVPARPRDTHKGRCGRLLVVGGCPGMTGAILLAGEAAMRAGAGLVRLASLSRPFSAIPELMVSIVDGAESIAPLLSGNDVVAIGPGLGQDIVSSQLFNHIVERRRPGSALVLDADALRCLARDPINVEGAVVTPHPGEAASLLGCNVADIQDDRFAAADQIARNHSVVCVLKGAGTVISDGARNFVCNHGDPAMATAGTGDVLTGIIAALLGQGLAPLDAARLAVYLHARAGEAAAGLSGVGLVASDLLPRIAFELTSLQGAGHAG